MFNLRDAPNTRQKLKTLHHHLVRKVNVKEWFYHQKPTISMDRALIFCSLIVPPPPPPQKKKIIQSSLYQAGQVSSDKFEEPSPMTTTRYNSVVRGIPTDPNTIYTGLKVIEGQMKQLGQDIPVTTFDLQLYVIAQNLRFKHRDILLFVWADLIYWRCFGKSLASDMETQD